ncbi:putative non-specific lipid-transfer protein type 2 [Helianthus anomalus]
MVLLLSVGQLQLIEAQSRCELVEISLCLQSIISNMPPSQGCCQKLKGPCNTPKYTIYLSYLKCLVMLYLT